jgi:hypothetical protein
MHFKINKELLEHAFDQLSSNRLRSLSSPDYATISFFQSNGGSHVSYAAFIPSCGSNAISTTFQDSMNIMNYFLGNGRFCLLFMITQDEIPSQDEEKFARSVMKNQNAIMVCFKHKGLIVPTFQ